MDEKIEDTSEESKKNHIIYYKSLSKVISDIENEKTQETGQVIHEHLDKRIDAMKKDQKRIRDMFPNVSMEEWDGNIN